MSRFKTIIGFVALSIAGCSASSPNLPDVLLITWDTVRADHVGEEWTPTWNQIANRAVVFTEARTPVPITLPAHATMMTGELPPIHGARDNGTWPVNGGLPTLAEQFQAAGWTTGAFVSASVLDSRYGIARGFSTFDDHIRPGKTRVVAHRIGTETVGNAIDWLMDKPPEKPVFLWVHLFDPHRPWEASTKAGITDYQAAIQKADLATSKLLDAMEARGRLESSIITITSDHGEGLGEHGEETHGYFAYDSTIRVPLMVWVGDDVPTARATQALSITGPASLHDIPATLLASTGLPPIGTQAMDLLEQAKSGAIAARTLTVETVTPALDFDTAPIFGVIDNDKRAWFDVPKRERYHLDSDPKQLVNRYDDQERTEASVLFQKHPRRWPPSSDPMALSEEDREALESLGYITRSEMPSEISTIDPKDRVDLFNLLTNTPPDPALQLIDRSNTMIEKHGMVPALMLFKADLYDALARPIDALATVKQAATHHPTDRDLSGEYLQRSRALEELRRLAQAIEDELKRNPNDVTAQRDLAVTYHRSQRFEEAESIYRRLLESQPRNDEVRVDLARMFASQQRYDAALSVLAPAMRRPERNAIVDCMAGRLMSRGKGQTAEANQLLKFCD